MSKEEFLNYPMFQPIQCTSAQLFSGNLTPMAGQLFFLTDTKQIYLAKKDSVIEMCGGINIFYGNRTIEHDNNGLEIPPEQNFVLDDLEGNDVPAKNDLILNKDGCFYRIVSVSGEDIESLRITLNGSSSSTTTGGVGGNYSLTAGLKNYVFSSTTKEMSVSFTAKYLGDQENYIGYIGFSLDKSIEDGAMPFYEPDTSNMTYSMNEEHFIDLIDYIDLFDSGAKTVYLNVEDAYGNPRSTKITIKLVELSLEQEYYNILKSSNNSCDYSCYIGGATTGIDNKKLTFAFYLDGNDTTLFDSYDVDLSTSTLESYSHPIDVTDLPHGIYTMKVTMSARITGTQKTLDSNTLTHKIIKFADGNETPLLTYLFPNSVATYVNNELSYYFATNETKIYTLIISVDNEVKQMLEFESNTLKTYPLFFESEGVHNLTLTVSELGVSKYSLINVTKYSSEIPWINPNEKTLSLYLTPQNKSNDSVDKKVWYDYKKVHKAQLDDNMVFSSASGWLVDDDNISHLRLTSGSSLVLPTYKPFENDPTAPKVGSNKGQGLTIELDFSVDGITDFNSDIISCVSQNADKTLRGAGFTLQGNTLNFYSKKRNGLNKTGALTSTIITENRRTRVTFVLDPNINEEDREYDSYFPMCYTYIDGILSNAVFYDKKDEFKDLDNYFAHLKINTNAASVRIYGIRFYNESFSPRKVLNNYIATLPTWDERSMAYYQNEVYSGTGDVDLEKITSEEYENLQIPYMLLTGGYKTDADNDKWQLLPADKMTQPGLPVGKKDYRLVDVKVVYPKNDYFNGYNDYEYINTFDNGKGISENSGVRANNGGCIMYAQGTSSMEYPIKNLRLRWKKEKNYFTVRPNIDPVEIICMKADYMESSGSHNTGAANLIDDLYKEAKMKTPGQSYFGPGGAGNKDNKEIVTCIKGHPCLIFYSPTGAKGSYQYIGKYNLNLDKATPKPFGFDHSEDNSFGWLPEGYPYWAITYDDEGETFIGQEEPDVGGDYERHSDTYIESGVAPGAQINAIHCFEFLDNAIEVCNFLNKKYIADDDYDEQQGNPTTNPWLYEVATNIDYKKNKYYIYDEDSDSYILDPSPTVDPEKTYYHKTYNFQDSWYRTFNKVVEGKVKQLPGWAVGFESRYPEDRVGYHDADMLYPLASWLNELYYLKKYGRNRKGATEEDIAEANLRFKDEYQQYFDKKFLLFYYIVTEVLLMADSRTKNMMIATWGPETRTYKNSQDQEVYVENQYIWYPIFYDMDTMLGLDNTGVNRFKYYEEDTNPDIYNGDEVLWNFVRDNLSTDLLAMYNDLEGLLNTNKLEDGSDWSPSSLIPYFNKNQANMANEVFYNGDALYKYINPARSGYTDHLTGSAVEAGVGPYLYALQGNRSLHRENFLVNRINYLQGKYSSAAFQDGNNVEFRWNYPSKGATEWVYLTITFTEEEPYIPNLYYYKDGNNYILDTNETPRANTQYYRKLNGNLLSASAEVVNPSGTFQLTALQPCYAGVKLGRNGNVIKTYFNANDTKDIDVVNASSANNTEAYILGLGSLKDLGDLSTKYVQKFIMKGTTKLSTLTLGNPHKVYYNPYWSSSTSSAIISLEGCPYLENFNLQNCISFQSSLNFTPCPIISKILLTGSSVSGLTLPRNGQLTELRLPITITDLNIDSHRTLTKEGFSIGGYNYTEIIDENGVDRSYIGNGSYENDYSMLQTVNIINTPIDTYEMISNAPLLSSYYLEGIEWEIRNDQNEADCAYLFVSPEEFISGGDYYIWNIENKAYEKYTGTIYDVEVRKKVTLLNDIVDENGEVVKKSLTTIPILDWLLTRVAKKGNRTLSDNPDVPGANGISGTIKIAITAAIDQYQLQEKYTRYFPNLKFEFDKDAIGNDFVEAYNIKFYSEGSAPYYSVFTQKSNTPNTLGTLTSKNGPNGYELPHPTKIDTNTQTFVFKDEWTVEAVSPTLADGYKVGDTILSTDFDEVAPQQNLSLRAQFQDFTRYYNIQFFDENGVLIKPVTDYQYGQTIASNPLTVMYAYKKHDDDTSLDKHMRYGFKGWINETDYNNLNKGKKPTIVNLYDTKIDYDNMKLYAYFGSPEDCRTVASNEDFFEIIKGKVVCGEGKNTIELFNQNILQIKKEYVGKIKEPITFPSRLKDTVVDSIGVLIANYTDDNIPKVYFLSDSQITSIGGGPSRDGFPAGIYGLLNLKLVYFNSKINTLKYIGNSGMSWNTALTTIVNLADSITHIGTSGFAYNYKLNLNSLPSALEEIGNAAFYECNTLSISNVPPGVTAILEDTFYNCSNLKMADFGHSLSIEQLAGNDNNISQIECGAFYNAGSGLPDNTIYFHDSLTSIKLPMTTDQIPAFGNYGRATGDTKLSLIVENVILRDSIKTNGNKYFGEDYYVNHINLTQD